MNDILSGIYKSFHSIDATLIVFSREGDGVYHIEIVNKKARNVLFMPQNDVSVIRRLDKMMDADVYNQVRHHTEQLYDESAFDAKNHAFYIVRLEEDTYLLQITPTDDRFSLMADINMRMLDNLSLLFIVLDSSGNIVSFNRYFQQLAGSMNADLTGENYFSRFIHEEQSSQLKKLFLKSITHEDFSAYYENLIDTRKGARKIKWYSETRKNPLTNEIYMFSFGRDITGSTN